MIVEHGLVWEQLPTRFYKSPCVWHALLNGPTPTAMLRNLGRMTSYGVFKEYPEDMDLVLKVLCNSGALVGSRIHPLAILAALTVYGCGSGLKGNVSWVPHPKIKSCLDEAFKLSFGAIQPTNKRIMIGLDVSGSMDFHSVPVVASLSCREAAAALAMVFVATEPHCEVLGFSHSLVDVENHQRRLCANCC